MWEYKILSEEESWTETDDRGYARETYTYPLTEESLNVMGKEGWEVVSARFESYGLTHAILKRKVVKKKAVQSLND